MTIIDTNGKEMSKTSLENLKRWPTELTLSETLEILGWRSEDNPRTHTGTRLIFDDKGNGLGAKTAHETWQLLRERGLIQ